MGLGQIFSAIGGNLIGGIGDAIDANANRNMTKDINSAQLAASREYATNGIQWRVADAKKAGIHPLAAMGLPLASAPTLSVGNSASSSTFGDMGQSIARAADAVLTAPERQQVAQLDALKLERAGLENELLRTQISSVQRSNSPPLPVGQVNPVIPGQGNAAPTMKQAIVDTPAQRVVAQPGNPGQEAGSFTDISLVKTPQGYAVVPSKDAKDRIEDQFVPEAMWAIRNQVLPGLGLTKKWHHPPLDPKAYPPPKGYRRYEWNPLYLEYRPVK